MNLVRKTYIEFYSPGAFLSESSTREVKTRDLSKIKMPKNAFGFRFFDILSASVKEGSQRVLVTSERINVSPMHYYGGKLYTVAELKRKYPNQHTLISNIESNGYKKAIQCRTGNWQPFNTTDIFIRTT